ncbi:MAG: glycosyltransferase, partial [Candidatus Competibacterales bacterium]|nr:glycosyltransferase [Candidatus Competibacterales bacterium]
NTIGSPSADWPHLPDSPRAAGTPLRLVFLGVAEPHKGLPLLLEALAGMADHELAAIDLALYVRGIPALGERLGALRPRLAGLSLQDGYRHDDLPRLLAGRDLGVVPPIWWDNAPQVVFELLALGVPVLGTRIGGIPDFVSDGVNGLLVEPHDPAALAAGIRRVLADPALTSRLRQGIRPMKSLRTHADELETFYTPGRG